MNIPGLCSRRLLAPARVGARGQCNAIRSTLQNRTTAKKPDGPRGRSNLIIVSSYAAAAAASFSDGEDPKEYTFQDDTSAYLYCNHMACRESCD